MKLNTKRAQSAGINTGAAVVGAVIGHAGTKALTDMVVEKSPDSKLVPHIPAIVLGVLLGAQALDIIPAGNGYVDAAIMGASVTTGMAAVREYSGANDDTKNTAGIAEMVNKYVPGLSGVGMGYTDYSEAMPQALLSAGRTHVMLPTAAAMPAPTGQNVRRAFAG